MWLSYKPRRDRIISFFLTAQGDQHGIEPVALSPRPGFLSSLATMPSADAASADVRLRGLEHPYTTETIRLHMRRTARISGNV